MEDESLKSARVNSPKKNSIKCVPIAAFILALMCLSLPACNMHKEVEAQEEHHTIVLTSPQAKDVTITQPYVCQIRSQRNIDVQALASGFLEEIPVKEGQAVKEGDVLFKILPTLYQATLNAEKAEVDGAVAEVKLAQVEYEQTKKLYEDKNKPVVSQIQVTLDLAKLGKAEGNLAKARAKLAKAEAEFGFTTVKARFDGIVDRQYKQLGSKIKEDDVLTTLSDNSVMRVYFNVPEARYLEIKGRYPLANMVSHRKDDKGDQQAMMQAFLAELNQWERIELMLADGTKFPQIGKFSAIEGQFNNETGNIPFRADFRNPERLLRHGQTGNVLIHRTLKSVIVIPQRATIEILDKRYVYVVGDDDIVHQREIVVAHEMEDIFVIKNGIDVGDRIVLDGVRQVREGQKLEGPEYRSPEEVFANQKNKAE
jgi:membrane fusion protein, multidrug efflux system